MFITTLNNRTAFDEVFDDFFNRNFNVSKSSDYKTESDEDGVTLTMNVPGYNKKLIDVSVEADTLVIKGQSNSGDTEGFEKSFILNDRLDADNVEATIVDGVLTITVPYRAEVKPRKVEVKVK
jgi:HSP20 family molecular chaperone IbpA